MKPQTPQETVILIAERNKVLAARVERLEEHNRRMKELLNDLVEDLQGGFDFSKEYQRAGLIGAIKVALLYGHEHESLNAALAGEE